MREVAASGRNFESCFLTSVEGWSFGLDVPVLLCGMVGSRQGWHEAGYLSVPQPLGDLSQHLVHVPTAHEGLSAYILPGLKQADPFDVMRGEETQLAGYLGADSHGSTRPVAERICLPGTHAKWARVDGGVVTHFSTALTGELFDMLSKHSILAHSLAAEGLDGEAFADSVQTAFRDPACLTEALFSIRAEGLLIGEDGARARGRLSGLLIGAEFAGAHLEAGEAVTLIGAKALNATYARALGVLGHDANSQDGEAMVLNGLSVVHGQFKERLTQRVG
jgi:2-dehydro-3-deoxygalactonokinase